MKLRLRLLRWRHIGFRGVGLGALTALVPAYGGARDPAYDDVFALFGGALGLF